LRVDNVVPALPEISFPAMSRKGRSKLTQNQRANQNAHVDTRPGNYRGQPKSEGGDWKQDWGAADRESAPQRCRRTTRSFWNCQTPASRRAWLEIRKWVAWMKAERGQPATGALSCNNPQDSDCGGDANGNASSRSTPSRAVA